MAIEQRPVIPTALVKDQLRFNRGAVVSSNSSDFNPSGLEQQKQHGVKSPLPNAYAVSPDCDCDC